MERMHQALLFVALGLMALNTGYVFATYHFSGSEWLLIVSGIPVGGLIALGVARWRAMAESQSGEK